MGYEPAVFSQSHKINFVQFSCPQAVKVRVNFGDRPFAYGAGHAHRDAADVLEGESTEEVVAHFDALPFAVGSGGSDSDDEGVDGEGGSGGTEEGGGGVVELSQARPHTRKLKSPIATVGEWTCVYVQCHVGTQCKLCGTLYMYMYMLLSLFLSSVKFIYR